MTPFNIKYQIFVSSTYQDLIAARSEIIKSILGLYHIPIGMEMFSADNEEQWSTISDTIQNSDYYLLIVGHRYGSLTKEGISYTEKEFDFAKSSGIPILAFLQDENAATKPSERDKEVDKQQKLAEFREKVGNNAMIDFWKNENELAQKAVIALYKLFQKTPRIGWIKADKATSPAITEELASLSKENRELKYQVEQYKVKEEIRLPDFTLFANDQAALTLPLKKFGNRYLMTFIEPLKDTGDVTMTDLSSDPPKSTTTSYSKKIKEYNAKIAENVDEVKEYNTKLERQLRISDNNAKVTFSVENTGSKKANELYVEITFPEEILLFDELPEKETLTKPKDIPQHPYEFPMPASLTAISGLYSKFNIPSIESLRPMVRRNFQVKGNQLTIKLGTLLHTRQQCMNESIFLVPLRSGTFNAEVSFMCEELKVPIRSTFEIIVSENE